MTELPEEVCEIPNLRKLHLGRNRLKWLPDNVTRLTALESLWLCGNLMLPRELQRDVGTGFVSDPRAVQALLRRVPFVQRKRRYATYFLFAASRRGSLRPELSPDMRRLVASWIMFVPDHDIRIAK